MVKVPVLSDAIISVEPRGFNSWQLRTIELRLARVVVPSDKEWLQWQANLQEWLQPQRATATIKPSRGCSPRMKTLTKNVTKAIATIR